MNDRFVLRDGNDWWVHVPMPTRPQAVYARARGSGERLPGEPGHRRDWWRFAGEPASLIVERPPLKRVARWVLKAEYEALAGKPFATSYPDYAALEEGAGEVHMSFYEPETVEEPVEPEELELGPRLDGSPPPEMFEGLEWRAELPYQLRYMDAYHHLFPGTLHGGAAFVAAALRHQLPESSVYHRPPESEIKVYKSVPFEPRRPSKTRRDRERATITREGAWKVYLIRGNNAQAALDELAGQCARILAEARELSYAACGHCNGAGYVAVP